MEDAATAEISRSRYGTGFAAAWWRMRQESHAGDGVSMIPEEMQHMRNELGDALFLPENTRWLQRSFNPCL